MKKISIKQAIVNAVDETDSSLTRYEVQAMRWARYIEREIGSINAYDFKAKAFEVEGSTMDVPKNCLRVRRIVYGDYENQLHAVYRDIRGTVLEKDERTDLDPVKVSYWAPAEIPYVPDVMWEERVDIIQFVYEMKGRTVTIFYDAIEVDNNGYWMVSENHIKAITDYIIYMFAKKHLWKTIKSDRMLRQGELANIQMMKNEYSSSIRNARALDNEESEFERKQY